MSVAFNRIFARLKHADPADSIIYLKIDHGFDVDRDLYPLRRPYYDAHPYFFAKHLERLGIVNLSYRPGNKFPHRFTYTSKRAELGKKGIQKLLKSTPGPQYSAFDVIRLWFRVFFKLSP